MCHPPDTLLTALFCRRVFVQYNAREAAERDLESIFDGCLSYSPHTRPFALVGGERARSSPGRSPFGRMKLFNVCAPLPFNVFIQFVYLISVEMALTFCQLSDKFGSAAGPNLRLVIAEQTNGAGAATSERPLPSRLSAITR